MNEPLAPTETRPPSPPADPGAPPLGLLAPFERTTFRFMELLAKRARPGVDTFLRTVGRTWVWAGIGQVLECYGLERLASVSPDAGVMLVANHRSFFDLYLLSTLLYRSSHLQQGIFCPVRADFFYQQPLGIVVNLLCAGGRMYPPVFREPEKLDFNKWAIAETAAILRRGHVMVGMHPEGRRNKNESPYEPLPAQPGVGKLVMDAWPVIVPAFINGLGNDIVREVADNFRRKQRVIAVFGEPIDTTPFRAMKNRLASHKRIADRLLERVYQLGEEERAIRARPRPTDR